MGRLCLSVLYLLFLTLPLFLNRPNDLYASEKPENTTSAISIHYDILKGIDLLYNEYFDQAEETFQKMVSASKTQPEGHFYLAMVSWSRLSVGFWSPEIVSEFRRRIDRAIEVAKARIGNEEADSYDFFYLGGALGFKGRFELMRGEWLASFFLAREAIDALKTCIRLDPQNKDVLLGLGTFEYYTARLSGVLKFLSYLLIRRGNKEEGLRKLNIAANEAVYSSTEAKNVLMHIYLFLEQDIKKALSLAEELSERYTECPRHTVLKGVCYIRLNRDVEFRDTVHYLYRRGKTSPNEEKALAWARRATYLEASYDLFRGHYGGSREKLTRILSQPDPDKDPAMVAWPLIKIGMSYDLEGDKEKAAYYYRQILEMTNGSGAQFLAQKYLEDPPEKSDPFLGY